MRTRRISLIGLALFITSTLFGQKSEVHILAVNDMHANIEAFPKLAAIADSLRSLYPSLLVFSAGDNRTGNPLNDMYEVSSYPMVSLMNQVGFNATAVGNHEFDVKSLAPLMGYSNFSYICANMFPSPEAGLHNVPTQMFDVDGIKVGVIGVIQVNTMGRPDTHPENVEGIRFVQPESVIGHYRSFSEHCDATILLSHIGYQGDLEMAERFPWLDLIIGGHTHTQLTAEEPLHNGVLITQNKNRLPMCTHITLTVSKGKVTDKKAEYINLKTFTNKNKLVTAMVDHFSDDPFFKRVVAQAEAPFKIKDQMTYMLCDALLTEGHGDICIMNNGGTRIDSLSAGDITVHDILAMDPFYNEAVFSLVTGEDIMNIITTYSRGSLYHLPRVAGILCEAIVDKDDPNKDRLKSIQLKTLDGKDFDIHRTYRLVTSSYMATVCRQYFNSSTHSLNMLTSDMLTQFLEKKGIVNYEGVNRLMVSEE
jgi:2',3'-cyclic-nucleotide 2'-phosphodiesterase (5'-nucleotidase family)